MPDAATLNGPSLLGIGLYTAGEVERLTEIPAAKVRRWICGYAFRSKGERQWSAPLWEPQVPRIREQVELGFRDLVEIRIVDALLKAGLSLHAVRRATAVAREVIADSHPLSTNRFRTDGTTIFLQVAQESEEPVLLDLLKRQYGLSAILEKSLKDLDFGIDGGAVRWWPMGKDHVVVLDPGRSFGQPIVNDGGVPTRALADAVKVEGSVERVARLYEIPKRAVREAVAFEGRMAA